MKDEELIIATVICLTIDDDPDTGRNCFACPLREVKGCIPILKEELVRRIINSLNLDSKG